MTKGGWLVITAILLATAAASALPVRTLSQMAGDVVWPIGAADGVEFFVKRVYSEIDAADTRTLAAKFSSAYADLGKRVGKKLLQEELRMLFELRMNDLELTMHQMRKLGVLLHILAGHAGGGGS